MAKQEQYKLNFIKINYEGNKVYHRCNMIQTNQESLALSELLNYIGKYPEGLIDEIDNAQSGQDFDEIYSFDTAPGDFGLKILPPNAIIEQMGYSYTISLIDLKELLEEWRYYLANG